MPVKQSPIEITFIFIERSLHLEEIMQWISKANFVSRHLDISEIKFAYVDT